MVLLIRIDGNRYIYIDVKRLFAIRQPIANMFKFGTHY